MFYSSQCQSDDDDDLLRVNWNHNPHRKNVIVLWNVYYYSFSYISNVWQLGHGRDAKNISAEFWTQFVPNYLGGMETPGISYLHFIGNHNNIPRFDARVK